MNCKIIGTKEEINAVGVDYNISDLDGIITREYDDGWCEVEVTCYCGYLRKPKTIKVDLPKTFLECK